MQDLEADEDAATAASLLGGESEARKAPAEAAARRTGSIAQLSGAEGRVYAELPRGGAAAAAQRKRGRNA